MIAMLNNANDIRKTIANNVRNIRYTHGYNQTEIANVIGVTYQQLQKYETSENRIAADDIYRLAMFMQVEIKEFFNNLPEYEIVDIDKNLLKFMKKLQKIKNEKLRNRILSMLRVIIDEHVSNEAG